MGSITAAMIKTELAKTSFTWCFDYNYDRNYDCRGSGCDSICRCSRISNIKVENSNRTILNVFHEIKSMLNGLMKKNGEKLDNSKIFDYALERVMRAFKFYDASLYTVSLVGGYYGDEIGDTTINVDKLDAFCQIVNQLLYFDDTGRIYVALNAEYEYILPWLTDCTFEIKKVSVDKMQPANTEYMVRRVDNSTYLSQFDYDDYGKKTPLGIYRKDGSIYRVIDGYHRLSTAKELEQKKAYIIVATKIEEKD